MDRIETRLGQSTCLGQIYIYIYESRVSNHYKLLTVPICIIHTQCGVLQHKYLHKQNLAQSTGLACIADASTSSSYFVTHAPSLGTRPAKQTSAGRNNRIFGLFV